MTRGHEDHTHEDRTARGTDRMAKPRMTDVARLAGVDTSTVSRALNESTAGMLRPETVARVVAASTELGYLPNVLARGLRTRRSRTVGMLVPDITNPFFPPVVRGIEDELSIHGYTLLVTNSDNEPVKEERALANLVERQVDAVIVATSQVGGTMDSRPAGIPMVFVNRRGASDLPYVVPDDAAGVRLVVRHLAGLGHRAIGHVAGPQETSTGRARLVAFRAAMAEVGLVDDAIEVAEVFGDPSGRRATSELLDRRPGLTALLAANDLLAVGALRELRARGVAVPATMSLTGYNDMPLVDLLDPPLTTVRVPQYEMGRTAARLVLGMLEGGEPVEPVGIEVPPELVVRASTAAPPA